MTRPQAVLLAVLLSSLSVPNVIGDPVLPESQRTLGRWYNVGVFALPTLYTAGNAGKGILYGPGRGRMNMTFAKRLYGFGNDGANAIFNRN